MENVTFTLIEPLERWDVLGKLLTPSHLHEKQRYLTSLLRLLGKKYLDPVPSREANWWTVDEVKVSGIAAILKSILQLDEGFKKILLELFQSNAKVGTPIGIRRAIIATLQDDESEYISLLNSASGLTSVYREPELCI